MPLYEHVFLARQDISQQQVEALAKEFSQVIEEGGGRVAKNEYWGLKSLAFKIKKSRKAHYSLFNLDAPPAAVAEMERRMGLSTDIIRFMTVRVEELETEPSAQMRKSDREDRRDGDRGGFRGERGGFRGGDRGDRPPREVGFRAEGGPPREGGSTFRPRPPREGGAPGGGGFGAPRAPRPPRDAGPKSEG